MRKTFVSELLFTNLDIATTSKLVGHEDKRTTLNNYSFEVENKELLTQLNSALSVPSVPLFDSKIIELPITSKPA